LSRTQQQKAPRRIYYEVAKYTRRSSYRGAGPCHYPSLVISGAACRQVKWALSSGRNLPVRLVISIRTAFSRVGARQKNGILCKGRHLSGSFDHIDTIGLINGTRQGILGNADIRANG
jgi:hypothetical protein